MRRPDPLVESFEAARVDASAFGHREHLYVAWWYLRELPLEEALVRYVHHLRRLAAALGVPEKYHATITWAYLVLLHEVMQEDELAGADFESLLARHPSLLDRKAGLLSEYYEPADLASDVARRRFVLPRPRRQPG
jgi:hypothetical protein